MTCAEAVRQFVLTLGPVTSLVNSRVWTYRWPQSPTLPAVLVQQVSDVQEPHLRGTIGLKVARVQVDCLAATIGAAREVDAAVQGEYSGGAATGLRGAVASVGSPAFEIRHAIPAGYREVYDGDELRQARTVRDYLVWYDDMS